jgi:hypothetical protein
MDDTNGSPSFAQGVSAQPGTPGVSGPAGASVGPAQAQNQAAVAPPAVPAPGGGAPSGAPDPILIPPV